MAKNFGYEYQGAKFHKSGAYSVAGSNGKILYARRNDKLRTRDYYSEDGKLVDRRPINDHFYGTGELRKMKIIDGKKFYFRKPIHIRR